MTTRRDPFEVPPSEDGSVPDIGDLFRISNARSRVVLERFGLAERGALRSGRVALLALSLCAAPLLLLAALDGLAWGERVEVPLLRDFIPAGRMLLTLPLLVFGETIVGERLARVAGELRRSDILGPADTRRLEEALARAVALWNDARIAMGFLFFALAIGPFAHGAIGAEVEGDWQKIGGHLTPAGLWYLWISIPVLRFLVLRWLFRFGLWSWVLWRASKLSYRIFPVHPDRSGGLAFLGETQEGFALFFGAAGVQVSCLIADGVMYRGADLHSFQPMIATFALFTLVVLFLPLAVFVPKLVAAKERSLLHLSGIAYRGGHMLMQRFEEDPRVWPAEEISGLSDFSALYETARRMRPLPMENRNIVVILVVTLLPFAPLVFFVVPPAQVLGALASMLF